jgi:hypothetical protein
MGLLYQGSSLNALLLRSYSLMLRASCACSQPGKEEAHTKIHEQQIRQLCIFMQARHDGRDQLFLKRVNFFFEARATCQRGTRATQQIRATHLCILLRSTGRRD